MKVMAIASITKPLSPEQRQQIMPNEVPATLNVLRAVGPFASSKTPSLLVSQTVLAIDPSGSLDEDVNVTCCPATGLAGL